MPPADTEITSLLSDLKAIWQASENQRDPLIEKFKQDYPDQLHWLEVVSNNKSQGFDDQFMPNIPGYRLVRLIGSGGNGRVYLAADKEGRQCAIKTPNIWLNAEQLTRFKHEARVLARLDHPHIAKVLDFGEFITVDQRLPYLVMSFVNGEHIDDYVKRQNLSPKAVVELYLPILDALQYAHQKSVIHRDIKPDNIVVNESGQAMLLDFGVATLGDDATIKLTKLTETGQIMGTLAYMSPEQITGVDKSDSRSDIYSAGVVLYELLTGRVPIEVDAGQFFSAVHEIIHQTPTSLLTLNKDIDDGLAAVVHHAIEKNSKQRYQSVPEFIKDIKAWLQNEPLSVATLSKWYWLKQAARKNKALVTGTALAFVGLLTGLVFAVSFAFKEKEARDMAEQKAESNRQVVQFINDLFVNADPTESLGEAITVKQVIQGAEYSVDKDISDEPEVEAQIRLVLGNVFDAIQLYPSAISQYQKGLDRLKNKNQLYFELATQKLETLASNTQFEQLMQAIQQLKSQLKNTNLSDEKVAIYSNKILFQEATYYATNSQVQKSLVIINQLQQRTDLNPVLKFSVNKYRGIIQRDMGEFDQAEQLFRSELEKAKIEFGELHPTTLDLMQELALTLREKNQIDQAIELYDSLIIGMQKNYGENSLSTLLAKINKATAHMYAGDFARADKMTEQLLPQMIEHVGSMHRYTVILRNIRAGALQNIGKLDDALILYQEALDLNEQAEVPDDYSHINFSHNIAIIYKQKEKFAEVEAIYREIYPLCLASLNKDQPLCVIVADSYALALIKTGNFEYARELLEFSNPAMIKIFGEDHPRVVNSNKTKALLP